jgi:hypothetical protein
LLSVELIAVQRWTCFYLANDVVGCCCEELNSVYLFRAFECRLGVGMPWLLVNIKKRRERKKTKENGEKKMSLSFICIIFIYPTFFPSFKWFTTLDIWYVKKSMEYFCCRYSSTMMELNVDYAPILSVIILLMCDHNINNTRVGLGKIFSYTFK